MTFFSQLDLRQRFNLTVFVSIAVAASLLIILVYGVTAKYADDYSSHYWQEHAKTFADSVKYPVIMGSTSDSKDIAQSFTANQSILKASIYTPRHELLTTSGRAAECQPIAADFTHPFYRESVDNWCFYSPISQNSKVLGHVELIISKVDLKTVLQHLLLASGLIILVFSVFIFIIVRRFSAIFTTTLVEISEVLESASLGTRGVRVSFSGAADIDQIRDTFNDLLEEIELNERVLEQRVTDRTHELKIALDSSQSANQYKSQIMALVTHEMKTPLNAISSFLQLALEKIKEESDDDIKHTFYSRALVRANELNELIDNILLQAKLETIRYELSCASIDLQPLMQKCAEKAAALQHRNQNRLLLLGQDLTICLDAEIISHIVNNLLSNACKFTRNGDIELNWRLEDSDLVIQVSDTGCGIDKQYIDKIFDAFCQVDMSMTRRYGGVGLGLAITDKCVQLLGGTIAVKPNVGKGTIFTVRIPSSIV
jgi:signal transduction histidine kinase